MVFVEAARFKGGQTLINSDTDFVVAIVTGRVP
jgi:hypothetical protein